MSNKIKWIVCTVSSYGDKYGNCYHRAMVWNTRTGKSTEWISDNGCNMVSMMRKMGIEWNEIHYYTIWMKYNHWKRTESIHLKEESIIKEIKKLNRINRKNGGKNE